MAETNVTQPKPLNRVSYTARNAALWVLQILGAAFFFLVGLSKVTSAPAMVTVFENIGAGQWFRYLVGSLEIAGAIGLLIPVLAGLAGLAFAGLLVGAIITDVFVLGTSALVTSGLLVLALVIAWGRWSATVRLFNTVARPTYGVL